MRMRTIIIVPLSWHYLAPPWLFVGTPYSLLGPGNLSLSRRYQSQSVQAQCAETPDHPSCPRLPVAALTNDYKLGSVTQIHLLSHSPGGHRSEMKVWAGLAPSRGSEEESVPPLSQLLGAASNPHSSSLGLWVHHPFLFFRLQWPSFLCFPSFSPTRTPVPGLRVHSKSRMISGSFI